MWTLCQLPNCFLLFFVSGELFLPKSDFYETSELLCHKEAFQDECFLTLLYDEWKPVSLNKLKIMPPRRQKSFFLCQKRSVSRNNFAKGRNRKSQYTSGGNMYFNQAPLLLWVLFSSMIDFVYHLSRCNESNLLTMRSDLCSCRSFAFASRCAVSSHTRVHAANMSTM